MQTNYTFIGEHAKQYGVSESIVLHTIIYFVLFNKKHKRNEIHGKYWTFNSANKWRYFFPFFSQGQIRRYLKSLVQEGALLEASYNKKGYDKTLWHTLSDSLLEEVSRDKYWQKRVSKMTNTCVKNDKPIPDIYTTDILDGIKPY
jgi:hypothetical protein